MPILAMTDPYRLVQAQFDFQHQRYRDVSAILAIAKPPSVVAMASMYRIGQLFLYA